MLWRRCRLWKCHVDRVRMAWTCGEEREHAQEISENTKTAAAGERTRTRGKWTRCGCGQRREQREGVYHPHVSGRPCEV